MANYYEPKVYKTSGGDKQVVASGGTLDIESGGAFKIAGTQVTSSAAELNLLDGATATAAEINQLDVSANGAARKIKVINMTASDFSDNSEVDTGWTLPATCIIENVYLKVNTKETTATTKTIDVGTDGSGSNDPDGLLTGVSVENTGLVKGTVVDGAVTFGALLLTDLDGVSSVLEPDITSGGESITVTPGDAGGFTEADFDIIIEYIEVA